MTETASPSLQFLRAHGDQTTSFIHGDLHFENFSLGFDFYNSYNVQRAENVGGNIYRLEISFCETVRI